MTHIKPDAWTYYEMTPERMAAWFKQQSDDQIRVLAAHHVWYPGGPPRPEPALPRQVSVRDIIAECAAIGGLAFGDIVGARRTKDIIPYRHAAAYLAAIHCRHISLPSIGKRFGGRDHTTILSACNRVKEDLAAGGERFGAIVGRAEKRLALR